MHHDQIMESYTQLTPLNNYLSNCVIKLHIKLHYPSEDLDMLMVGNEEGRILGMGDIE